MAATETKTYAGKVAAVVGRIGILIFVAISFLIGLFGAVYLSLRSPEVAVPEVVGKDQSEGRSMIEESGLNLRVRASRFAADARANTILDQSPRPGEVVKVGQTIAVVVARSERREGEANTTAQPSPDTSNANSNIEEESAAADSSSKNASNSNADRRRGERADRNQNRNASRPNTERNANRNTNVSRNTNGNSNLAGNANRVNNTTRPGNANRATPAARPTPPAANAARPRVTNANRP